MGENTALNSLPVSHLICRLEGSTSWMISASCCSEFGCKEFLLFCFRNKNLHIWCRVRERASGVSFMYLYNNNVVYMVPACVSKGGNMPCKTANWSCFKGKLYVTICLSAHAILHADAIQETTLTRKRSLYGNQIKPNSDTRQLVKVPFACPAPPTSAPPTSCCVVGNYSQDSWSPWQQSLCWLWSSWPWMVECQSGNSHLHTLLRET